MVSIMQERTILKEIGLADYRLREDWGARRSYTDSRTVTEPATRVFVHITVTNPGNYSSFDAHARAIESIGISRFPATGISYNRLIQAGTLLVYEGQPVGRRGAHTVNDFRVSTCTRSGTRCPGRNGPLTAPSWNLNYNARAYVYCANVQHSFDDNSLDTMARAIASDKLAGFVTKSAEIHGHRCVSAKSCPGENVFDRLKELEGLVNAYMQGGVPMALDKDDVSTIFRTDGVLRAPSRAPDADSNPHWFAESHLRTLGDRIIYPKSGDPLIKLITDRINKISIPTPVDYSDDFNDLKQQNIELQNQHVELQSQVQQLQSQVNLLTGKLYLSWGELGDSTWDEIESWNSLDKTDSVTPEMSVLKTSAKEGAQEALSQVNLEVSWE